MGYGLATNLQLFQYPTRHEEIVNNKNIKYHLRN
jgi:hypothetical protein